MRKRLAFEPLEERSLPSTIALAPQVLSVEDISNSGPFAGYQLRPAITPVSEEFVAPPGVNSVHQVVQLSPIEEVAAPSPAEWAALYRGFSGMDWRSSVQPLADRTFEIASAEAMGPDRQGGGATPAVGEAMFVKYSLHGSNPAAGSIHWLQFVTTSEPLGGAEAGVPVLGNLGSRTTPFVDGAAPGVGAGQRGFVSMPSRRLQNDLITWHADMFLVQDVGATRVVWSGLGWGWQTVASSSEKVDWGPTWISATKIEAI